MNPFRARIAAPVENEQFAEQIHQFLASIRMFTQWRRTCSYSWCSAVSRTGAAWTNNPPGFIRKEIYMVRRSVVALMLFALSGSASAAFAQTVNAMTAAVVGKVTDESDAILPGVTVTIKGPSLMGTKTDVTDGEGSYRLTAVPPGSYTVDFELQGFATVHRTDLSLGAGFTANVNMKLGVATLKESVTVTGQSPVVDTAATNITTRFDANHMATLPGARDYWAILSEAPSVKMQRIDVGGSAAGTQTTYVVYGTTGQNRPMIEGINSTEGTDAFGNYVDMGSFEEVSVGTGASSAEVPVPGVYTQLISKTGGNKYNGSFYGGYEDKDWQSYNIDADQVAAGVQGGGGLQARDVNRLDSFRDLNGDIGGFAKKDKFWYYASVRQLDSAVRYVNFPVEPHRTTLKNFTVKGTYLLNQNNRLVGYYQPSTKVQYTRLDRFQLSGTSAFHTSESSSFRQNYHPKLWKAEWNSTLSNSMYVEARVGAFGYKWPDTPNGTGPSFEDLNTNAVSGKARSRELDIMRNQALGSLSYFKSGWLGTHNFKFGGEWFRETSTPQEFAGSYNDVVQILRNALPIEVYLMENPVKSENGLYTTAGYVTDTWKVADRLSLNLGVRMDHYRNFLPAQEHPANQFSPQAISFAAVDNVNTFNQVAPRVGLTYDVTGSGKTVLKANVGQYWWNPGAQLSTDVNPNPGVWWKRYAWSDANNNGVWDPGEQGNLLATQGGVATTKIDPNLKDPYTLEAATWFEHELFANFGLRTGYVWRGENQLRQRVNVNQPYAAFNVPVTIPDPGPDGVRGNADDGADIAGYNLDPAYASLSPSYTMTNVDGAKTNYKTWEITGTKRMSNRWSAMASYAKTWSHSFGQNSTNQSQFFGTTVRQDWLPITPNDLINASSDGAMETTDWQMKFSGTYEAPFGIRIAPFLRVQSGQNFGRTILASFNYGSARILAEPMDTRRQDTISVLDTRVEKALKTSGATVSFFLDLYNITNTNANQNQTWSSGSSFLRPTAIVPPRVARLGTKVTF
jgi:Carboxypeptidase regulatory-like domain/TonB dependent receptor